MGELETYMMTAKEVNDLSIRINLGRAGNPPEVTVREADNLSTRI
jgi:hypothetical protein